MKKFLAILCVIGFVAALSMPVMAQDPIVDNQLGLQVADPDSSTATAIQTQVDDTQVTFDSYDNANANNGSLAVWDYTEKYDKSYNTDASTETITDSFNATDSFNYYKYDYDVKDSEAVAIDGGFAIAVEIKDVELNLAYTDSYNNIQQTSTFSGTASSSSETKVFESDFLGAFGIVKDNIGLTGANFTAGNFNNNANLNSVNATIQF